MSYCDACQYLGAWLTSEETVVLVKDFLIRRPRIAKWLKEPGLQFSHHKTPVDLWKASDNGCLLCQLLSKYQTNKPEPESDEGVEIGPLVFHLVSNGQCAGVYCNGEGWDLRAELEIYEVGDAAPSENPNAEGVSQISEIWKSRQHLSGHPLSEKTIKFMNGCVQECLNSHDECNHTVMGEHAPTRLIDVGPKDGSKEPFLVELEEKSLGQLSVLSLDPHVQREAGTGRIEGSSKSLRYATLSHCWGGTPHLQTTMETLEIRKRSIPLSSMNQTFRDAVKVTRSLELQYLWIDSLCIIQDSPPDWLQESAKMSFVYSNAKLNIAAIASGNGDETFLHSRPIAIEVPQLRRSGHLPAKPIWIRPTSGSPVRSNSLFSRAWCYQEDVLSPRALNFDYSVVSFQCRVFRRYETMPNLNNPPIAFDKKERIRFSSLLQHEILTQEQHDAVMALWHDMVNSYSGKGLSFAKDKLPAVSGLASHFGSMTKSQYIAGLWSRDLPYGLCWAADDDESSFKVTPYRAPTWSWASQNGPVSYEWFDADKIYWDVQVLDHVIDCVSDDLYGQVNGGYIKLEGRMIQIQIGWEPDRHRGNQCYLRQGDLRICNKFVPDEYFLVTTDKVFWCMFLGVRQWAESPSWYPLLLVLKQIDGSTDFERVGYICDYNRSDKVKTLWDGVDRTRITLL